MQHCGPRVQSLTARNVAILVFTPERRVLAAVDYQRLFVQPVSTVAIFGVRVIEVQFAHNVAACRFFQFHG